MYNIDILSSGQKIKKYREAKGLSSKELGNAIGKTKSTIVRYENGEIVLDFITAQEIANVLNIDLNDICEISVHTIEKSKNANPFNSDTLYLYYISKNGLIISKIEIETKKYGNYVLMKNALKGKKYKQEYTGMLESNYNTAFFCLTNAITNPGLDKFQIEIDLHSKFNDMYFGLFLGVSDNTHRPTARKCIITTELFASKEKLNDIFHELEINEKDIKDMQKIKYWDMKSNNIIDYVINL